MLTMGLAGSAAPALAAKDKDSTGNEGSAPAYDQNDPGGGGSAAPNTGGEPPAPDESGGTEYGSSTGRTSSTAEYPVVEGYRAKLLPDGHAAAPSMAPAEVQRAIWAANELIGKPYVYGGGHNMKFKSRGYDCSGTVSYALHGAGLLSAPLDSGSFMRWGAKGKGSWFTIWTNQGHAFVIIAGLRLDTSPVNDSSGARGPRWRPTGRSARGFVARHPAGF
jgi:cell wall-associated NlpC family hydrolase